jgi:hypothetical protein
MSTDADAGDNNSSTNNGTNKLIKNSSTNTATNNNSSTNNATNKLLNNSSTNNATNKLINHACIVINTTNKLINNHVDVWNVDIVNDCNNNPDDFWPHRRNNVEEHEHDDRCRHVHHATIK